MASTVRGLLLALTSTGAAVVAFDVLFAEADRTSIETIVKQLPPEEAKLDRAMDPCVQVTSGASWLALYPLFTGMDLYRRLPQLS